jgi:integrase
MYAVRLPYDQAAENLPRTGAEAMARTLQDAKLDTRAARQRLRKRREPFWRSISEGLAVGYRKGTKGGTWIARHYSAEHGRRYQSIGTTDDIADADGTHVLSFAQAQEVARAWFADLGRQDGGEVKKASYSVREAVEDYLNEMKRRGGKSVYQTRRAAETHILPALGDVHIAKLRAKRITDWHQNLAEQAPLARSTPGKKPNHRKVNKSADGIRARRATANRVLTVLKAALNHAWKAGHVASDDAWRRVKPFKAVDTARVRYLSEAECVRLVNGCEPTFRNLVRSALLTGCRYFELANLHVADFNADAGVLTVRESKGGKPRHVVLTDEGRRLFATLTAGKLGDDAIFLRADGGVWGKSHQLRRMADACGRAKIKPAVSFHVLRHTHGSTLAMRGVPMGVIAEQLGHADTRMTEKHYAHLAPSYVADTIRAHFPTLGIAGESVVAPMQRKG